jgi:cobalt-zinc-cadmium resistance protein CzcA
LEKNKLALDYYETTGLVQADEIIAAATSAYEAGDISFAALTQYMAQAVGIRQNYLDQLQAYNQAAIELYFLNNQ